MSEKVTIAQITNTGEYTRNVAAVLRQKIERWEMLLEMEVEVGTPEARALIDECEEFRNATDTLATRLFVLLSSGEQGYELLAED